MRSGYFGCKKISIWLFVLIVVGFAGDAERLLHLRIKAQANRVGGPVPYTVILASQDNYCLVRFGLWLRSG